MRNHPCQLSPTARATSSKSLVMPLGSANSPNGYKRPSRKMLADECNTGQKPTKRVLSDSTRFGAILGLAWGSFGTGWEPSWSRVGCIRRALRAALGHLAGSLDVRGAPPRRSNNECYPMALDLGPSWDRLGAVSGPGGSRPVGFCWLLLRSAGCSSKHYVAISSKSVIVTG